MHPLLTIILNPFAGAAGFNLVSVMFYLLIAACIFTAIVERSFKQ